MASNYKKTGAVLTLTAPYQRNSGQAAKIGAAIFGVALNTVASGAKGEFRTTGVFTLPKTSALEISVGDRLFWDDAAKVVNKTAASNLCVGYAVSDAANPSDIVDVRLVPSTPAGT